MSTTDDNQPPGGGSSAVGPAAGDPDASPVAPPLLSTVSPSAEEAPERDPGWFDRNAPIVIAASVAVIVLVAALVTLFLFRESAADGDADTEAAVIEYVEGQGGQVESIECTGRTCAAIVGTAAYTVLVQEDEDGEQHFGITPYIGD